MDLLRTLLDEANSAGMASSSDGATDNGEGQTAAQTSDGTSEDEGGEDQVTAAQSTAGDGTSESGLVDDSPADSSGIDEHGDPWHSFQVAQMVEIMASGAGDPLGSGRATTGAMAALNEWASAASPPATPGRAGGLGPSDAPEEPNLLHYYDHGSIGIDGTMGGPVVDPSGEQGRAAASPVRVPVASLPDYQALLDERTPQGIAVGPGPSSPDSPYGAIGRASVAV